MRVAGGHIQMTISKDKAYSLATAQHARSKRTSNLEAEFEDCAAAWKRETGHLSVAGQIAKHHAYRRIIDMGEPAIPLILRDLREKPNHWFLALSAIANEAPQVSAEDKGDMQAVSEAWIRWGKDKGYIE